MRLRLRLLTTAICPIHVRIYVHPTVDQCPMRARRVYLSTILSDGRYTPHDPLSSLTDAAHAMTNHFAIPILKGLRTASYSSFYPTDTHASPSKSAGTHQLRLLNSLTEFFNRYHRTRYRRRRNRRRRTCESRLRPFIVAALVAPPNCQTSLQDRRRLLTLVFEMSVMVLML